MIIKPCVLFIVTHNYTNLRKFLIVVLRLMRGYTDGRR